MSEEKRALTYGEKAVGLTFNPSGDGHVRHVKELYAEIIDKMHYRRLDTRSPEQSRLYSVAITQAQIAQMCAVKAITWED